ncbi:MAG: hypothetical protein ACRD36_00190 [Candidatus Acidiferrum sp.]
MMSSITKTNLPIFAAHHRRLVHDQTWRMDCPTEPYLVRPAFNDEMDGTGYTHVVIQNCGPLSLHCPVSIPTKHEPKSYGCDEALRFFGFDPAPGHAMRKAWLRGSAVREIKKDGRLLWPLLGQFFPSGFADEDRRRVTAQLLAEAAEFEMMATRPGQILFVRLPEDGELTARGDPPSGSHDFIIIRRPGGVLLRRRFAGPHIIIGPPDSIHQALAYSSILSSNDHYHIVSFLAARHINVNTLTG